MSRKDAIPCALAHEHAAGYEHGPGVYGTAHGPVCAECYRLRQVRGLEGPDVAPDTAGMISRRLLIGQRSDGSVADGAHDSWHDTPVANPDDHHQFPIVVSGVLMWQQGPAVHFKNAKFDEEARNYAVECRRAQALREVLFDELGQVDVNRLPRKWRRARRRVA